MERVEKNKKNVVLCILFLCMMNIIITTACAKKDASITDKENTFKTTGGVQNERHQMEGLEWQAFEELEYATGFAIEKYNDGFRLITLSDGCQFLLVPKGREAPETIKNDICVINQPVDNIYLVATAVMDMFRSLDAINTIRLSGTDADGWYIAEAKQAIESGRMLYAGKYNTPDYELILSQECRLAIENTMILHTPEVKEQLEQLGIAVLVDYASNESHPLGRVEWIKLYGALLGKEDLAKQIFDEQVKAFETIEHMVQQSDNHNETVAFFYLTQNGAANVRRPSDYIPKMIVMAGGTYIFDDLETDGKRSSSMTMQMEEFYARAKSADYLIYNSSINGECESLEELLEKDRLLEDFDAVKNHHVWCTSKNFYQESMAVGGFITDIYAILNEENPQTTYLYRLE